MANAGRTSSKFERDKFLLNQRRFSIKEKYYVYDEEGTELFYVERPFQWGRRNITVFEDDSKSVPVLFINQDQFWEMVHREYTVLDAEGQVVARLSRNNFSSLFRRGWRIMNPGGGSEVRVREQSMFSSILRRIVNLIPLVGLFGGVLRTNFEFLAQDSAGSERRIGTFNRRFTISDKYVLDISEDSGQRLDRRVALAVGVLLDTAEKR
jgi:uncharacterized protein YxjI